MAGDGLGRARFDGEPEARGVAQDAPDADRVLGVARVRVADDADAAGREVFEAADVIDDRVGGDVVEEGVDGQVAAEGVLAGRAVGDGLDRGAAAADGGRGGAGEPGAAGGAPAERPVRRCGASCASRGRSGPSASADPRSSSGPSRGAFSGLRRPLRLPGALGLLLAFGGELLFAGLAAEGRDLDDLAALEPDVGQAEAAADEEGVAEELLDLVGMGVRADVEVGRLAAEEEVADRAADEVGRYSRWRSAGRGP